MNLISADFLLPLFRSRNAFLMPAKAPDFDRIFVLFEWFLLGQYQLYINYANRIMRDYSTAGFSELQLKQRLWQLRLFAFLKLHV